MKTIELPFKVRKPVLACGADLKGAFALAAGDKAYLAEGFGSLDDPDNLKRYEASVFLHEKRLGIRPAVIARDLHPDYHSSRFAEAHAARLKISRIRDIQHHTAHVAAAVVEHSIPGVLIGVAFDGSGYGADGRIWGGEFFTGSLRGFHRAAYFEDVRMPGGDAAVREPWRMAVSHLYKIYGALFDKRFPDIRKRAGKFRLSVIRKMIDGGINSPFTSSAGRLFDAAGSLILSRDTASFEAELPIELEKIAEPGERGSYRFGIKPKGGVFIIEASAAIKGIASDLRSKADIGVISARFHNTIAGMIAATASILRRRSGSRRIALSGGVFQNRYLTKRAVSILSENGFCVYTHAKVNANDNGIPVGQLAMANAGG
ncbi:MAG: hypothetical protein V1682_01140 [Candidatus Omnitrophota bacterium]